MEGFVFGSRDACRAFGGHDRGVEVPGVHVNEQPNRRCALQKEQNAFSKLPRMDTRAIAFVRGRTGTQRSVDLRRRPAQLYVSPAPVESIVGPIPMEAADQIAGTAANRDVERRSLLGNMSATCGLRAGATARPSRGPPNAVSVEPSDSGCQSSRADTCGSALS